eukprot:scaffold1376_cov257-Pinguiococcus_pyrenoidosus.AAC.8
MREDHTLGNLLRMELLKDQNVRFAGYIAPHPLEHVIKLRVQAADNVTPIRSVTQAVDHLQQQFDTLSKSFESQVHKFKET